MSRDEAEGLEALFQDMMESDLPDPDLLARYATEPNELTADERAEVETAMQRSQAVVDELDTLRDFDFAALDADREAGADGKRRGSWLLGLLSQPVLWAGVVAAAALLLWIAAGDLERGTPEAGGPTPMLARESEGPRDRDSIDSNSLEPATVPLPPTNGAERLAESDRANEPRAMGERPESSPEPKDLSLPRAPEALVEAEPLPGPTEQLSHEQPESLAATGPSEPSGPDPGPDLEESSTASREREILVAMVIPAYEQPMGAAGRERIPLVYRSSEQRGPAITILSPAHVARSSSVQPTLAWSIDTLPSRGAFYLTVMGPNDEPLIENRRLAMPTESGIQTTSLSDLGVSLKRNIEYRWSIAHRLDEESPPTRYAFGWVEAVEMSAADRERADRASPGSLPDVLAREGYWYDALQATLELRDRHPDDERPEEALQALLEQGEISGVVF
jgi:hypothetical protein